jgi:prolyl oligopeptidase
MENAYSRLCVYETDGSMSTEIELPTLGSTRAVRGRYDSGELFFEFESFTHPPTIFRYDLGTHQMAAIDRMEIDVDLSRYEAKQIWLNSKDGTRVPMFVIHKQGIELNGDNPTVLGGYGGFNISVTPRFLQHPLPFLDAGGVYALVNLRGGGEFGEQWHQAGQLERKQNVFDDMIAACEKLIADKYTRPQRLALRGASNGGLLMGAMITQRPDLFKATHCAVPLLDMVRYHRFSIARLWIPEYGSAEDPEQFKYLHAYSPYHHVKRGVEYPAVLFTTAESDSRVDPMHARKMTALMQAVAGPENPILLWVEQKAGHGKGKPLHKRIAERVDSWIFLMWQLGMLDEEA